MEMGERFKGQLSHASSYGSSRTDRYRGSTSPPETCYTNQRKNNPSTSNWQRSRRQAGGTDNPAENYYISDSYRKLKKIVIPNSSIANYSPVQNTDQSFRCPQNHRSPRNKIPIVDHMGVMRKENESKQDTDDDADDDDDDDDRLEGDAYYDDDINIGEEGEENQDESCGSCETTEKDRDDLDEDVEENYEIPLPFKRFPLNYEKDSRAVLERLKILDLAQKELKMSHQRRIRKHYQELAASQRICQVNPEHDVSDEATDDEASLHLHQGRKLIKQPINCRQPNSWSSSRNQDKYNPIRSPQTYHYPRKNESTKSSLEPPIESYEQRRCRNCGSYSTEPVISKKNNCRTHESMKVSFKTKGKFDGESGDPGDRCSSGRRIPQRSNFAKIPSTLSSQKPRRSRNTKSPNRE